MKRAAPPNIRSFLWKMLHRGFKVGKYWNNIPGYKSRSQCPDCEQTEDMNHILFVCPLNHRRTLWLATKNIFKCKQITWPQDMDHMYVMAAPLLKIKNQTGKARSGASRLCTITILECAWLTWKERCRRVIGNDQEPAPITKKEVLNKLRLALNDQLRDDVLLTNMKKYGVGGIFV